MGYLHEYFDEEGEVYDLINDECKSNDFSVEGHANEGAITASIKIFPTRGRWHLLSEFPGNCSSLVLSEIQNYSPNADLFNQVLQNAETISEKLEYAALFVSGTSMKMRGMLEARGYVTLIDSIKNPHSGNDNYFMVKYFTYSEDDDEGDECEIENDDEEESED